MHQLRFQQVVLAVAVAGFFALPASIGAAQTQPDNTKVNTRDRATSAVTADQQKDNASDRDITKKIRRSLMSDKTLSSYAHNVKVIAQDGQVTLKGPVRSDEEKQIVEAKATDVAGVGHVTNQLRVAPSHSSGSKD
jgi:hyperosmotically inducible protein